MNFKAFYDSEFKHIGFLPDDENRALSDRFIRVTEEQWLDLLNETNQIIYDSVTPGDLTKIKIQVKTPDPSPWAAEEKLKSEKKAKKDKAIETVAKLQAEAMAVTAPPESLEAIKPLFDVWEAGKAYAIGKMLVYQDILYKVIQANTSQADWTPATAVSLYAKVLTDPAGAILPWVQPGSTNPYMTGDKVTHNGKTWTSTINNNVWAPGVYGWTEVN